MNSYDYINKMIIRVVRSGSRGQMYVSIPKDKGIKTGDYVEIVKVGDKNS